MQQKRIYYQAYTLDRRQQKTTEDNREENGIEYKRIE